MEKGKKTQRLKKRTNSREKTEMGENKHAVTHNIYTQTTVKTVKLYRKVHVINSARY